MRSCEDHRAVRVSRPIRKRVVSAVDRYPFLGHRARAEPQPESEKVPQRRVQHEAAMRERPRLRCGDMTNAYAVMYAIARRTVAREERPSTDDHFAVPNADARSSVRARPAVRSVPSKGGRRRRPAPIPTHHWVRSPICGYATSSGRRRRASVPERSTEWFPESRASPQYRE
jgi:hypothetical protein